MFMVMVIIMVINGDVLDVVERQTFIMVIHTMDKVAFLTLYTIRLLRIYNSRACQRNL